MYLWPEYIIDEPLISNGKLMYCMRPFCGCVTDGKAWLSVSVCAPSLSTCMHACAPTRVHTHTHAHLFIFCPSILYWWLSCTWCHESEERVRGLSQIYQAKGRVYPREAASSMLGKQSKINSLSNSHSNCTICSFLLFYSK